MQAADRDIKAFLFANMYRHPKVKRVREKADAIVRRLFRPICDDPRRCRGLGGQGRREPRASARAPAADYIAGMTDRFAIDEYRRLFDPAAKLR